MIKKIAITLAVIFVLLFGAFQLLTYQTKKASPEQLEKYMNDDIVLEVVYCSPSKKGRTVMDSLVPFGEVWRTGANEATTFTVSKDITISGQPLPAGTYTLWTIPNQKEWEVIFNSGEYGWGVNWSQEVSRDASFDVLNITTPVMQLPVNQERFTIQFEGDVNLTMAWENTKISMPISL